MSDAAAWTNAAYARLVAKLTVTCAKESEQLAEGMWNPDFCSARPYVRDFLEDVEYFVTQIQGRANGHMAGRGE